jgi:sodium-dependent phosphate cotransporter
VEETAPTIRVKPKLWDTIKVVLYIVAALLLFLFALELMTSSLQHLGKGAVQTIIQATSNPFAGLFIGLLITAMIQSSSTTSALAVAMVASGSLTIESAVPVIMGANIGTTVTSIIVSLAFINKKKEFKRAVSAGGYHYFFNVLTALVLFPLEYYYGFLSSLSVLIAGYFYEPVAGQVSAPLHIWPGTGPVVSALVRLIPNGIVLIVLSFVLVFASILLFRKLISDLLKAGSPEAFGRFFFTNPLKSFLWGLLTTAAIRSKICWRSCSSTIRAAVARPRSAPFDSHSGNSSTRSRRSGTQGG